MAMTRQQAMAYLASQGRLPPSASAQSASAVDLARASAQNPSLGWTELAAQGFNTFAKKPSAQDRVMEAWANKMEKEAGIRPTPSSSGDWSSMFNNIFGGTSSTPSVSATPLPSTSVPMMSAANAPSGGAISLPFLSNLGMGTAGATGATEAVGAAGATGTAGATSGLSGLGSMASSAGSVALPAAAALAAGYGLYRGARTGIDKWKEGQGSQQQGLNTLIGTVSNPLSGLIEPVVGGGGTGKTVRKIVNYLNPMTAPLELASDLGVNFWSGKHKDQVQRDKIRKELKKTNLLDDAYNVTLANNQKFDIGADGKTKNYNVDFNKTGASDAVGSLDPLSILLTGQSGTNKKKTDLTGYLANAAMSSGDTSANIKKLYNDAGYDYNKAFSAINEMQSGGKLSEADASGARYALNKLYQEADFKQKGKK